ADHRVDDPRRSQRTRHRRRPDKRTPDNHTPDDMIRRPLVRLFLAVPLCGMLIAGLLTAGWLVLGRPTPAKGATWFQVTRVGDSEYSGAPDQPFFFLALGNDGRNDTDMGLGDAIHVIGVNPATHQATIINVPRDTTAPAGDKINAYHSLQ